MCVGEGSRSRLGARNLSDARSPPLRSKQKAGKVRIRTHIGSSLLKSAFLSNSNNVAQQSWPSTRPRSAVHMLRSPRHVPESLSLHQPGSMFAEHIACWYNSGTLGACRPTAAQHRPQACRNPCKCRRCGLVGSGPNLGRICSTSTPQR